MDGLAGDGAGVTSVQVLVASGRIDPDRVPPAPWHRPTSALLLLAAAVLLWTAPAPGVVLAVAAGTALAPWGRTLAERLVVSVVVSLGTVAVVFSLLTATGTVLSPAGWRVVVSLALLAVLACLWVPRSAPVLARVDVPSAAGLSSFAALVALLALPLRGLGTPLTLGVLLDGWDNSSHLPMFVQVMHAQNWDMARLGPDVMFSDYPMLHAAVWSVGEWVSGTGPGTDGLSLVGPYVAWTALSVALAGALMTWSAGLLTRSLVLARHPGDERGARTASSLAAWVVAVWTVVGSLAALWDAAYVNFALGAALTGAALVVSVRSRRAMLRIGWFALPLAAVAVAYLYPPLVSGLAVAGVVVASQVAGHRRRVLAPFLLLGLACLAAVLPALRFVTEPFHGRTVGQIAGRIPDFEFWPALVVVALVLAALWHDRRPLGRPTSLALGGALVCFSLVALVFAAQSLRAGLDLTLSYYAVKMVVALLLLGLPMGVAVVATWVGPHLPEHGSLARSFAVVEWAVLGAAAAIGLSLLRGTPFLATPVGGAAVLVVLVGAAALLVRRVVRRRPHHLPGATLRAVVALAAVLLVALALALGAGLPGWTSLQHRLAASNGVPTRGLVEQAAAQQQTPPRITVLWTRQDAREVPAAWNDNVKASRTAAGLGAVLRLADDDVFQALGQSTGPDAVARVRDRLAADPLLSLRLVVPRAPSEALAALAAQVGPQRLEIHITPL